MAKKDERPTEAKHWLKLFDGSALYKHEPSRLFEDYLDLVLCCVANQQREAHYLQVAKRYSREELNTIAQLWAYHLLIHEHQTAGGGWYDMLGDIYMDMAGRSKTSRMGQFFTPAELCTMMARMTTDEDGDCEGKNAMDPCCGSGRMLLAMHSLKPKMGPFVGADLDGICVKMTALNFWLHGIRGEVAHMNSLSREWFGAYHVHPNPSWPFVTYLDEARKEESWMYLDAVRVLEGAKPVAPVAPLDLFNQVSEPEPEYGDPFRPCDQCGATKGDTCRVIDGQVMEPWEFHDDGALLTCVGCGAEVRNGREVRTNSAA